MKKILALVLAMLMAISCVFAAFAEDEQTEAAAVEIVAQQAAEEIAAEPIELPAPAEEAPAAEPAPAEEVAPVAAEEQPEVVEAEPEAVEAVDAEPEAVETEPAATEPETTEAEPEAVETEPEVIEAETEPEALESEPVAEEPAAEAEQPVAEELAAEEPEAVEAEPEVVESEVAETETESVEPEATEPVAEEPAEAETEVAPVVFEANFSAYLVNREQIVVGDAVYLFAVVTDANMAYTLTWETLRYVVPEGEEAALPTWQPLVVADNYSFFATMADNGSVYRAVLTAEDGTVIISGEITVTVVEPEEPAETEAPAEDNIIEETAEPTEEPVEETTEPTEERAEEIAEPTEEPVEETTEPAEEPAEEITEPVEEPAEEITEPTEEPAEEIAEPAEEPAEEIAEPAEEPVEETTEPTEEPAEEIAEPTEEPVEETAEPAEEPVEETTELTEEPVEETTEPAEEPVEETTEPTEEPAEEIAEPAEEIAEPIEAPAAQPIAQADVEVVIIDDYETPLGLLDGEYETEPVEANIVDAEDEILYTWQRAEDGSLILDEDGNPIVTVYGDAEVPVAYQRDENGALILDENGNPIPAYTVPQDALKTMTLEDALDPNRSIDIYVSWNGETPAIGGTATFIAVLNGYDNLIYDVQWQVSSDATSWTNVPAYEMSEEDPLRYSVVVTMDNYADYWRVEITVTDFIMP